MYLQNKCIIFDYKTRLQCIFYHLPIVGPEQLCELYIEIYKSLMKVSVAIAGRKMIVQNTVRRRGKSSGVLRSIAFIQQEVDFYRKLDLSKHPSFREVFHKKLFWLNVCKKKHKYVNRQL